VKIRDEPDVCVAFVARAERGQEVASKEPISFTILFFVLVIAMVLQSFFFFFDRGNPSLPHLSLSLMNEI